jgi:hypothetical protein
LIAIHSRKALETDPIVTCRNYRNFHYSGRGVYHQRIQHIQPDKIRAAHQAKDHGEEVDGRALRVYLPDGVNFVECAGKIIIELPDKPDGSISNNLCRGRQH